MRDIDLVIEWLAADGTLSVHQLAVRHAGDDDGIWFFRRGSGPEVQVEPSTGMCPFLVESDAHPERSTARSIREAVAIVQKWLRDS